MLASDATILVNSVTKQIGAAGASIIGTLTGNCTGSAATATTALQLTGLLPSTTISGSGLATITVRDSTGNITANQFIGTTDKSDRTFVDASGTVVDPTWNGATISTQYRTAKLTATAYSIVARNSSGDITANLFQGTATSARYADLAEKYLADAEYEVGTVMVVGGAAEVTASTYGELAIGVISENPAIMMNSELEGGIYVALKGRVPIKVKGIVRKGDRLVAGNWGCAEVAQDRLDTFAVAMESSDSEDVKLIESVVL